MTLVVALCLVAGGDRTGGRALADVPIAPTSTSTQTLVHPTTSADQHLASELMLTLADLPTGWRVTRGRAVGPTPARRFRAAGRDGHHPDPGPLHGDLPGPRPPSSSAAKRRRPDGRGLVPDLRGPHRLHPPPGPPWSSSRRPAWSAATRTSCPDFPLLVQPQVPAVRSQRPRPAGSPARASTRPPRGAASPVRPPCRPWCWPAPPGSRPTANASASPSRPVRPTSPSRWSRSGWDPSGSRPNLQIFAIGGQIPADAAGDPDHRPSRSEWPRGAGTRPSDPVRRGRRVDPSRAEGLSGGRSEPKRLPPGWGRG